MDANVSKIMAMVNGQNRDDFDCGTVSSENRAKIDDAIESVFIGKSMLIWANGGRLVDAWNNALDDLRDELFAVPNTSPVVEYLRRSVFNHRTRWQKKMLQSNERNSVALFNNSGEKDELIDHANALINTGLNTIQYIIANSVCDGARIQKTANVKTVARVQSVARARDRTYERVRKR